MIWVMATIVLVLFVAVAYPVTIVLTALVAGLIDVAGRFITVPWRRAAALERPQDVHHSAVRLVLAVATLFFIVLGIPVARERLGSIAVIAQSVYYGALLIAFSEWLEGRSARLAAWVCFGGMALYAFAFGANAFGRLAIGATFDAFACIGFLVLAMRAAREDDRARRSTVTDPGSVASL